MLVQLDPVVRLELRIGEAHETTPVMIVPPGLMGLADSGKAASIHCLKCFERLVCR